MVRKIPLGTEQPKPLRFGDRVERPGRATRKLVISTSPCCEREARIELAQLEWLATAISRRLDPLDYEIRKCGRCQWPYWLRVPDESATPLVVEWEVRQPRR